MRNDFFSLFPSLLTGLLLTSCYSTSPTYWSRKSSHDVIESREVIPNGSRLDIQADTVNGKIEISAKTIAQCRLAEIGYPKITETGQRNPHSWPGSLIGAGLLAGGGIALIDGLNSSDTETQERKDTRFFEILGGSIVAGIGAIVLGDCALSIDGCAPDPNTDTREYNGSRFKRWDTRSDVVKKDCENIPPKLGYVPLRILATWEHTKRDMLWKIPTDESGKASLSILNITQRVSAHCGRTKIEITSVTSSKAENDDSPSSPSQKRDESAGYQLDFKPVTRLESPSLIKDDLALTIAQSCFEEKQEKCIGPRLKDIEEKCQRNCNSEAGAETCQIEIETQLVPGLSGDELSILKSKYKACVAGLGIDSTKTSQCISKCTERSVNEACPRGW